MNKENGQWGFEYTCETKPQAEHEAKLIKQEGLEAKITFSVYSRPKLGKEKK